MAGIFDEPGVKALIDSLANADPAPMSTECMRELGSLGLHIGYMEAIKYPPVDAQPEGIETN